MDNLALLFSYLSFQWQTHFSKSLILIWRKDRQYNVRSYNQLLLTVLTYLSWAIYLRNAWETQSIKPSITRKTNRKTEKLQKIHFLIIFSYSFNQKRISLEKKCNFWIHIILFKEKQTKIFQVPWKVYQPVSCDIKAK